MACVETTEKKKDEVRDMRKYILVIEWSRHEVEVQEYISLEEINKYLDKYPSITKYRYWIAKVLFEG